jgi:hypothetical protein
MPRDLIENPVNEGWSLFGPKAFTDFDCLVDDDV